MDINEKKKYFEEALKNLSFLVKRNHHEDALNYAKNIALFAWQNFTGYYSSWKMEDELLKIAKKIPSIKPFDRPKNNKVLHIVSSLHTTGGHSKLVYEWIKYDNLKIHEILLTCQNKQDLTLITEHYNSQNIEHKVLDEKQTLLEKAFSLKEIASQYEHIILHVHPDDFLPILAFSDSNFITPIFFNNHADHIFWLGNSIIDNLIEIRESVIEIDKNRRQLNNFSVLPIIVKKEEKFFHKEDQNNSIMILSTGSEYKYKPFGEHHFFRACYKLVKKNPNIVINIVGVSSDFIYAQNYLHPQINLLGQLKYPELEKLENECDIYLEGFPVSSFTALLQPSLKGKYVHLTFNPYEAFLLFPKYHEAFKYSKSEDEWLESVCEIINNREKRNVLCEKQYEYVSEYYSIEKWKKNLAKIYIQSSDTKHKISEIKKDRYYNSLNERILSDSLKIKINHFDYLSKLSFFRKLYWIFRYKTNSFMKKYSYSYRIKFLFHK